MDKIVELLESPEGPLFLTALLAVTALLGGVLFLKVRAFISRSRGTARSRRGRRLEDRAGSLLAAEGFRVLGEQVPGEIGLFIDGERVTSKVHVDFLASRGGLLYAADSKSGDAAANPPHADVRRQLLEYCLTYGCDRALLVDMENRRINEIEFDYPGLNDRKPGTAAWPFILAILTGLAGLLAGGVFFD
jgi:hypothetical protein